MNHFTTDEVAKILDLSPARIRACARAGLVSPPRGGRKQLEWRFQDILILRTTKGLLDARVPASRIRRMLGSLRRQLPADPQLGSVTIYADGQRVVAWDGSARWQPDSGQFLFNFDVKAVVEEVEAVAPEPPPPAARGGVVPALGAEQWLALAAELESTSPEEARQAYHQALLLEPALADAHINLGRLYHQAKDWARAEAHYRAAVGFAPEDPVAHFNLGVVLDDVGRREDAARAYREAIGRDAAFADAHYNLGLVLEGLGHRTEAIAHLRTARRLYGSRR